MIPCVQQLLPERQAADPGAVARYYQETGGNLPVKRRHCLGDKKMIDWSTCPAVGQIPGKVSGAWVFTNTRVPLSHLFANLEAGATIEEFLDWFEGVEDWQVRVVLRHLESSLLGDLRYEAAV